MIQARPPARVATGILPDQQDQHPLALHLPQPHCHRVRHAARAGPASSITPRPRSRAPSRGDGRPDGPGGRASPLLSGRPGRVGTGDPGPGPPPPDTHSLRRPADRLAAAARGRVLRACHLGGPIERPGAGGLAEVARAALEQVAALPPPGVVEDRAVTLGREGFSRMQAGPSARKARTALRADRTQHLIWQRRRADRLQPRPRGACLGTRTAPPLREEGGAAESPTHATTDAAQVVAFLWVVPGRSSGR